jgi:signal peptidase II
MRLLKNRYFLSAVIFFTYILDRLFKSLVINKEGFVVIKDFLAIDYFPNWGIALSLPVSRYIIYPLIILILLIVFYILFISFVKRDYLLIWSTALIFSVALSNLIDRVSFGHVVDYINFAGWFPVFNGADAMIVVGVCLLFWKAFHGKNLLTSRSN